LFIAYAEEDYQALFARFVAKHKKNYGDNLLVYKSKYAIFKANVKRAVEMNLNSVDTTYGVTVRSIIHVIQYYYVYLIQQIFCMPSYNKEIHGFDH